MNYTNEWFLSPEDRISNIAHEMLLDNGVTLIIADVGTGKSYHFAKQPNVIFSAPLLSIVGSIEGLNVCTWNSIVRQVYATEDKSIYNSKTLVIDECHGIYTDFSYKASVIRDLISIFPYFRAVVLLSGTTKQEYFSSVQIDRVYRVHKPQAAIKEIKSYYYDKNSKAALESLILSRKGKRKAIALVNDIKLCKRIAAKYGDKALVVSSEVKEEDNVREFFASRQMTIDGVKDGVQYKHDFDLIIGTDSIREGLSIEDEVEAVDIFIYGHTDPDGIEQFCNRFRDVAEVKTVHYIVPVRDSNEINDFSVETYTNDAVKLSGAITEAYRGFTNDNFRDHFRTQYSQDIKGSHIKYERETDSFIVDKLSIDAAYSEHRAIQVKCDPMLFEMRMMDYDFCTVPATLISGDSEVADEIRTDMETIKREQDKQREEVLSSLIESYSTGKFTYTGIYEEYDALRESIDKLLKVGLKYSQIEKVIEGTIEDKAFIGKVWSDYNYVDEETNIRNDILIYIAKYCPDDTLNLMDLYIISNLIVKKVLTELFQGDNSAMIKNRQWKKTLTYRAGELVVKDGMEAKVINRYITLGERIRKRVTKDTPEQLRFLLELRKQDLYAVYPVKFTSLSGIEIEKPDASKEAEQGVVLDAAALRSRFMSYRMAA
ncbi:hypothetical protein [Scandinavium manionii]|uniref:hypothetical protein n=1 Tax=Scandinavium manionii TaxID=2926520 RepID=UPI0021664476|nr:hypothetical protein [Scandinavium manionii]MCS2164613.1 hypothetical protein [Scandinavium manionii]